jgi:hypothetical protein
MYKDISSKNESKNPKNSELAVALDFRRKSEQNQL